MSEVKMSEKAVNLKMGIYEHYKGKRYEVLGVVFHSETLEELVLYKALYGKKYIWVRPIDMFLENVNVDGNLKPRFKFIASKK